MIKDRTKALSLAASWWAAKVKDGSSDAGDPMINLLTMFVANKYEVSDEQLRKFALGLYDLLDEGLKEEGDITYLDVDYHPNDILQKAIDSAGIPECKLPLKTTMRVERKNEGYNVEVSNGYGQPYITLKI